MMKKTQILVVLGSIWMGVFCSSPLSAASKNIKVSLSEALTHAKAHSAEIKMAHDEIDQASGKYSEYKSMMLPHIKSTTLLIPIYKELGDPVTSKDQDFSRWGPWIKSTVEIMQPLYSFSRMGSIREAAEQNIEAQKGKKQMKNDEILFDVKKYYYNTQAAYGMYDEIVSSQEELMKVITRVDELLKQESGEVRKQDAYKLKTIYQELKQKLEFVKKAKVLAASAMAFKSGYDKDIELKLKDTTIQQEKFAPLSLEAYQTMALEHRPEYKALKAGLRARKALVAFEKKNRLPFLFIGGLIDINDTPNSIRSRQASPYAYDPYNSINMGAGLGMRWNLDFWKVDAKIKTVKAEYHELLHKKEMADTGLPLEVKKAFLEYQEALNNIGHSTEQRDHSKKWFIQSVMAWGLGVGDAREVLEAVTFKSISDKNYYEALMNHNIAIAALSQTTGTELLPNLKY